MIFYSNILLKPVGILYSLLHNLQYRGSGRVDIDIKEISQVLNKSTRTIYRYLNNTSFFRSWYNLGSLIRVYLVSKDKLNCGVKFEYDFRALLNPHMYAAWATALSMQLGSWHKAKKQKKLENGRKMKASYEVVHPHDFFDEKGEPSSVCRGKIHFSKKNNKCTIFMGSSYIPSGASLKGISNKLGVSLSSTFNYLKDVSKVHVFRYDPRYYIHEQEARFIDSEEGSNTAGRFYRFNKQIFKSLTCIYSPMFRVYNPYHTIPTVF